MKNLIDNAIKFTPAGNVTVRSRVQRGEWPPARGQNLEAAVEAGAGGESVEQYILEVEDTGIGIPPEDQERVFERFYTVNRLRGGSDRGTGLGLSIVKHAVNAMHGTVTLFSEPGRGQ